MSHSHISNLKKQVAKSVGNIWDHIEEIYMQSRRAWSTVSLLLRQLGQSSLSMIKHRL